MGGGGRGGHEEEMVTMAKVVEDRRKREGNLAKKIGRDKEVDWEAVNQAPQTLSASNVVNTINIQMIVKQTNFTIVARSVTLKKECWSQNRKDEATNSLIEKVKENEVNVLMMSHSSRTDLKFINIFDKTTSY